MWYTCPEKFTTLDCQQKSSKLEILISTDPYSIIARADRPWNAPQKTLSKWASSNPECHTPVFEMLSAMFWTILTWLLPPLPRSSETAAPLSGLHVISKVCPTYQENCLHRASRTSSNNGFRVGWTNCLT